MCPARCSVEGAGRNAVSTNSPRQFLGCSGAVRLTQIARHSRVNSSMTFDMRIFRVSDPRRNRKTRRGWDARPKPKTRSVVKPQTTPLWLLLGNLEPLPSPDPFNTLAVHRPAGRCSMTRLYRWAWRGVIAATCVYAGPTLSDSLPFEVFDKGVFTPNDQHFVSWHWATFPTSVDLESYSLKIHGWTIMRSLPGQVIVTGRVLGPPATWKSTVSAKALRTSRLALPNAARKGSGGGWCSTKVIGRYAKLRVAGAQ